MKELIVPAKTDSLDTVQEFIEQLLEENDCSMKVTMQISIAVEELFVNIAHYAYGAQEGDAIIRFDIAPDPQQVVIDFIDSGTPFNPLAKQDADTSLSADEREIGGLGILMVKKSMSAVEYIYKDGQNILTIKKEI